MSVERIGVAGAGTMGAGVAQCFAQAGYEVTVVEPDGRVVERARANLVGALKMAKLLGRAPEVSAAGGVEQIVARVRWAQGLDALSDVSFVVECVTERQGLKERVFAELDRCCPPDTVFASCTSAIPIAVLAACTTRPERVLGLHFMNPAPLKTAVEVVTGPRTAPDVLEHALALLHSMGKEPIVVGDGPGFGLNRVLMLMIAEAAASPEDPGTTDALFERCLGHPMGPLRTADLIGLDNVLDTLVVLREHTGDDRYTVPPALTDLVRAGHLGRKTGRGFHDYV